MTQTFKRSIGAAALGLVAATALATSAHASAVVWTLNDAVFNDGGTASGSFVYNADTGIYSDIDITTTAGSIMPGASYTVFDTASSARDYGFGAITVGGNLAGDPLLDINTTSHFTDAGGTVPLGNPSGFFAAEGTCFDTPCTLYTPLRSLTGSIIGSPTPEPAAWALLIAGIGLGGAMLRRRPTFSASVAI